MIFLKRFVIAVLSFFAVGCSTFSGEDSPRTSENERARSVPVLSADGSDIFPYLSSVPTPSTVYKIPREMLVKGDAKLGIVSSRLELALEKCGYSDLRFFGVPGGFGIVTRLEQIEKNGKPKHEEVRWKEHQGGIEKFSISGYLRALLTADPGYYRTFLFVVSKDELYSLDRREVASGAEVRAWSQNGSYSLPSSEVNRAFSEDYTVSALVYEFKKPRFGKITISSPSEAPCKKQLDRTGFFESLN